MAYSAAAGYGQFPRGNWSPLVYSQEVLEYLRVASVADEITNTDYMGDIKGRGDSVRIIKEPLIETQLLQRGTHLVSQEIDDDAIDLVIDQGRYYQFDLDDIEQAMGNIQYASKLVSGAAYALKDYYDRDVLQVMYTGSTKNTTLGTNAAPVTIGYGAGNTFTPLNYVASFARHLNENNVPMEGRFFVAGPRFYEALMQEDGKYIEADTMGDPMSAIRLRKLGAQPVHGFTMYISNNLPVSGAGNYATVIAGHINATTSAAVISDAESFRAPDKFADRFRGKLVWGRRVLQGELLFSGAISSFANV